MKKKEKDSKRSLSVDELRAELNQLREKRFKLDPSSVTIKIHGPEDLVNEAKSSRLEETLWIYVVLRKSDLAGEDVSRATSRKFSHLFFDPKFETLNVEVMSNVPEPDREGMNTKPSLRTDLAGVWARAVIEGIIASSSGNASVACTPFRNVRRGSAFFVMIMSISSSETVRS